LEKNHHFATDVMEWLPFFRSQMRKEKLGGEKIELRWSQRGVLYK